MLLENFRTGQATDDGEFFTIIEFGGGIFRDGGSDR
jgi:hypothetical protein